MPSRKFAVWSWDDRNRVWMQVSEGSERDMKAALLAKRRAAERVLPSARFTITPKSEPPWEAPHA